MLYICIQEVVSLIYIHILYICILRIIFLKLSKKINKMELLIYFRYTQKEKRNTRIVLKCKRSERSTGCLSQMAPKNIVK